MDRARYLGLMLRRRRRSTSGWLVLTALEDNCRFSLQAYGSPAEIELDVSSDGGATYTTSTFAPPSSVSSVTSVSKTYVLAEGLVSGQSVMLRGDNEDFSLESSSSFNIGNNWRLDGSKKFSVSGNLMALLDRSGRSVTIARDYMLHHLFWSETYLVDASQLSLPATMLASCSYLRMFYGCTALVLPPRSLPDVPDVSSLGKFAYRGMFEGCTSLERSPRIANSIPVEDFVASSWAPFFYTFKGCTSLREMEVSFAGWENIIYQWVSGVPEGGTFIKPATLPTKYGINYIPSGWTVIDK